MKYLYQLACILGFLFPCLLTAQQSLAVHFAHGTELFSANFKNATTAQIPENEIVNDQYIRYIQVSQIPTDAQRTALEREGITFIHYIDFGAYLVAIPRKFDLEKLANIGVRSIVAPEVAWKIHQNLKERPFGDWAVKGNLVTVVAKAYAHISIDQGARLLEQKGIQIVQKGVENGYILVQLPENKITEIAALPYIEWLELTPPPAQKEDTNGRSYHRSNLVDSDHPLGKKYNGSGVSTLVRDDGALGPHIDYQGRLYNQPNIGDPNSGSHGDGVGGIIGGAGNLDATKKGMAAGADVYVLDYTASFQDATMSLVLNKNVTVTNSSYSDGCNGGYTTGTQTVDQQVFSNSKLMHVFSAGNSNGSDCGYGAGTEWGNITGGHKIGKNVIATANLDANGVLATSSSRGPVKDGRLKPDISAHGAGQNSTDTDNTYQVFGGTSAASPGIAGCVAQLTNAYKTINNTAQAPSALLKLALLNTANEIGNIGPDYKYGWGHVNNYRALRVLEQNRYASGTATQNSTTNLNVTIPAGTAQAKLMLYWVDPAASTSAAKALVNDLDLTVIGPTGTTFRPWKLNPAPNPVTLDAPAGVGRDSLNNVEQVSITNPVAGVYTIRVKGFQVPMGPQNYYLCWEFLDNGVQLTYPAGGEGFVPGTIEKIRWDAYGNSTTFALKYSTNGGASYTTINSAVNANLRTFDWTVPNISNGNIKFAIIRGSSSDTTDYAFTIAPQPSNLVVSRVCPDSVTLTWSPVPGNNTLRYDIFQLGQKYMELKATSTVGADFIRIPIADPLQEMWFSIRASQPDGLTGRRINAIRWPGGLKSCVQGYDLAIIDVLSPAESNIFSCGSSSKPVTIKIQNNGQLAVSNASITYTFGTQQPVQNALPIIQPGQILTFTFNTPLVLDQNGQFDLKVNISGINGELLLSNNSITRSYELVTEASDMPFAEGFENTNALPFGWRIVNPDSSYTWSRFSNFVKGSDGQNTQAMWVDHYSYNDRGQEDYLTLIPIDLSNFEVPTLEFDYTHASYDSTYVDQLKVEVFPNCNPTGTPDIIWAKSDPELADTVTTTEYYPTWAGQWNKIALSLENYVGQKVIIRFNAVNGFGNSTFLDNIKLKNYTRPVANFTANPGICAGFSTVFQANPSPGANDTYSWTFGQGAQPATATGPGPHTVQYTAAGNATPRLIVSNNLGLDTVVQQIAVGLPPVAGFTAASTNAIANFSNTTTTNAVGFVWDFGDGATSNLPNPTHTFATDGIYTVTLTATNACGNSTSTQTLTIVTPPIAGFTAANNTQGCAPLSVSYSNASSTNATTFNWQFPGGTPASSTMANPTVVYTSSGTYSAILTVSNSAGSDTQTQTNLVVVDDVPTVGFTANSNDFSATFSNQTTNATTYLWNFGDGNTSTMVSPVHTYAVDGNYAVVLTATNNCGTTTATRTVVITTSPIAGFSANVNTGCTPFTVQYNNNASGNTMGWAWEFPGGTPATSNQQNPVVIYQTSGTYSATLTASNSIGNSVKTQTDFIVAQTVPITDFDLTVNGALVTATNTTQNGTSYLWDFGDGSTSTVESPTHTYASDGVFNITLASTNSCGVQQLNQNVLIATPPTAGFTASNTAGCAPHTVVFTQTASPNATSFAWEFPGGQPAFSNEPNPTVIYPDAGTYPVSLNVSNSTGSDILVQNDLVTVSTVPVAAFSQVIDGLRAEFTNTSSNALSYLWDFGDGSTSSTDANPIHDYANDGIYTVTLISTNGCGSTTTTTTITISTPFFLGFTALNTSGCVPLVVSFQNQSSPNAVNLFWEFPGGMPSTSTEQSPTVFYENMGIFNVVLKATSIFGDTAVLTSSDHIAVNDVPTTSFTVQTDELMATFSNTSQNATSYLWDFGDGTTSTLPNPTHNYPVASTYQVSLEAKNECGTTTYLSTVTLTVGIGEANEWAGHTMSLSPNPNDGHFTLQITGIPTDYLFLELYNSLGQLIRRDRSDFSTGNLVQDMQYGNLPAGAYALRVSDGRHGAVRRFVVQR
jgi:PKD repeat protein